jgi:hypothetical protein
MVQANERAGEIGIAPDAITLCFSILFEVTKELFHETARIRERNEMSAWQFVDGYLQSFSRDAPLEIDRKESIVAAGDHVDWNVGPSVEAARLAEHDIGLRALVCLALLDDVGRNVVEKVGGEVEIRAVAPALRSRCPRLRRSRVVPPLPNRLVWNRNHGVDEHKHSYANPRAHERRGETAKRLCDKDHVTWPDRFDDAIGVGRKPSLLVIAGQIDGNHVMLGLFKERHDTVPVPCNTACTRN